MTTRTLPRALPRTLHRALATLSIALATSLALLAAPAAAQVTVDNAWVRGTVPHQPATGAFMRITSAQDARLVAASSPAAAVVEIHEMRMDGGVMRMRAVKAIALPAGRAVELKPGGYHVMLIDLHKPLAAGQTVPITLTITGGDGKPSSVQVAASVRPLGGHAPMKKH